MLRFTVLRIVSAVVLLSGLVAAIVLCSKVIGKQHDELQATTDAHARRVAQHVNLGVLAAIEPLQRLGEWWLTQGTPAAPEDWKQDVQLFLSQSPGLREALWVDTDVHQRWTAVRGATPKAARTRPPALVVEGIATLQAGESIAISDVFTSAEGESAVYACTAISRQGRVQGYIAGLYDAKTLLSAVTKGAALNNQGITILDGGRQLYSAGPEPQDGEESAATEIRVANQVWNLELTVPLHSYREFRDLVLAVLGVVGALIYAFFVLLALSYRWSSTLQRVNKNLAAEVDRRGRAEADVRDLNLELSRKVADFETLLEVIPVGIAISDTPECRTIRVNPALADMLGAPPGEQPNRSIVMNKLPCRIFRGGRELNPRDLPMCVAGAAARTVVGEEDQILRRDGTVCDVLSFAAPLLDESGSVRGVLNVSINISERKRLEQRLQRAERMRSLGAMAAGIAHDFNNVLTGIMGQSSLAAEYVPEGSQAMHHITASLEATSQATYLVQKILAFTGHSPHHLRPTNLAETIRSARTWLCSLTAPRSTIELDIAPQLPEILADAEEVRQVLRNLVLNAAEATPESGAAIQIRVHRCELSGVEPQLTVLPDDQFRPGPYVCVEVNDSGAGMAPDTAERAFDPFFSTKFLGRGMGLSEVLGIMHAHHGAVRLATATGAGTSVQLYFPIQ